jgi:formylglycine-generating enzyme required for sulfatase activity
MQTCDALAVPLPPTGQPAMMHDQIFNALSALTPTQLDAVVYKLAVPRGFLPGPATPAVTVIVEVLRWAEQQGRLDDVVHFLNEVSAPARQFSQHDSDSAPYLRQARDRAPFDRVPSDHAPSDVRVGDRGHFPAFMTDIVAAINVAASAAINAAASAPPTIFIATDYAAYGAFSDGPAFDRYFEALKNAKEKGCELQFLVAGHVADMEHRAAAAEEALEYKKNQQDPKFSALLLALDERLSVNGLRRPSGNPRAWTHAAFCDACEALEAHYTCEFAQLGKLRALRASPPIYLWITETRMVWAVPIFDHAGRMSALTITKTINPLNGQLQFADHGFVTDARALICRMQNVWDYYKRHLAEPAAPNDGRTATEIAAIPTGAAASPAIPTWAAASGEDDYGRWAAFQVKGVQQRMRWIPPGVFLMGSPALEAGRSDDEGPQHWVTITKAYWLGETPVTQALWVAVMTENPSFFWERPKSLERPVERVSWDDCQRFLRGLNMQVPGLVARLPTEAEWERACKAETPKAATRKLDDIAWYYANSELETHPVGCKAANPFGLYDMLGNVWEWCADDKRQYTDESVADPLHAGRDACRVYRGGSWRSGPGFVRAAYRYSYYRDYLDPNLGFRLAAG